jgi:hypothetical protein
MDKGDIVYCFSATSDNDEELSGICEIIKYDSFPETTKIVKFKDENIGYCFRYDISPIELVLCCPFCGSIELYKLSKSFINTYKELILDDNIICDNCNEQNLNPTNLKKYLNMNE